MKFALVLALLAASPHIVNAQQSSPSDLATIDPAARDLLARLNARYKRFKTFQSIIELRTSEPVPWTYNRLRVQLTPFTGVVSTAIPGQGVEKRVFDGRTELHFNSRLPRVFQSRTLDAERYSLRVFLKQGGIKGTTIDLLSNENLAAQLLSPDLKSLALAPDETRDGQSLKVVVFQWGEQGQRATVKLLIDAQNLVLRHLEGQQEISERTKAFSFSETYSQVKFDEPLAPSLFEAKAPSGFKRVTEIPDEVTAITTPPVNDLRVKSK